MFLKIDLELTGQKVLCQEDRDGDAEESPEQQGQQRAVEGPPDLRQHTELPFVDVPGAGGEEAQAVFPDGRSGVAAYLDDDVQDQGNG